MSNIEKLVDFINECDPSGKLFNRFVAFLEMGLLARLDSDDAQEA